MYSIGDSVNRDQTKVVEYGLKTAESGDLQSQFNLAQAYRKGIGVAQDYSKAAYWYKLAAEAGEPSAQNEYGLLYAQGFGVPLDYIEAYAWISMPANAGNGQSIKNIRQLEEILSPAQLTRAKERAALYAQQYGQASQ